MACIEHVCDECNHTWFDNKTDGRCEKCGCNSSRIFFDEGPDLDRPDDYREDAHDE